AGDLLREIPGLSVDDRPLLPSLLLREGERLFGRAVLPTELVGGPVAPPPRARAVYVRNPLSDAAYTALSGALASPTVGYRQNLRELFDDVENGYADYAVLPLLSGGAAVPSVAALIEERGLCVTAVTPILSGEEEVTFGLLAREAVTLRPPTYFLFRVETEGTEEMAGLLFALSRFGLSLRLTDSRESPLFRGRSAVRLLVEGEEESFFSLLVYLTLFFPGFTGYGYYSEIQ
ncbi:MAG: hypothetical protein J6V07_05045, partial [Clostridia bacterium]|nr:hypothetical protein [Clostridia bacterium]